MDLERALSLHTGMCGSLHSEYPLMGIARAFHRNRRGDPISFKEKPYLIPLYTCLLNMERADFCKGVQTGISELFIQLMLYEAGWQDRIVAYVLPTFGSSGRFVADRVDPLLSSVPAYAARVPGGEEGIQSGSKGNLKRKRFGRNGALLFLGSNSDSDFSEFSADLGIIDELDECDEGNISKMPDRLRESKFPQLLRVSNPGIAGRGIHKAWKDGSRARYHHQCTRCGERQYLDWFVNFVRRIDDGTWVPRDSYRWANPNEGDLRPVCRRCKDPWTPVVQGGLWIAESPGKTPSFHMSRLDILPPAKGSPIRVYFAEWLLAQTNPALLSAFWRGTLGWPHEGTGQRISEEMLEMASLRQLPNDTNPDPEIYKKKTVIMGVDVGSVLNVWIDELEDGIKNKDGEGDDYRRRSRYICAVLQFEDLHRLIKEYAVQVLVIDAAPETRKAKEIRDHYAGSEVQVWLCRFHPQARIGKAAFGLKMEHVEHVITVDRTQLLDCTFDEIRTGSHSMPLDYSTISGLSDQLKAPVRKLDAHSQRYVWEEGNDPDHYRFADAYARVAQEIYDRSGRVFEL